MKKKLGLLIFAIVASIDLIYSQATVFGERNIQVIILGKKVYLIKDHGIGLLPIDTPGTEGYVQKRLRYKVFEMDSMLSENSGKVTNESWMKIYTKGEGNLISIDSSRPFMDRPSASSGLFISSIIYKYIKPSIDESGTRVVSKIKSKESWFIYPAVLIFIFWFISILLNVAGLKIKANKPSLFELRIILSKIVLFLPMLFSWLTALMLKEDFCTNMNTENPWLLMVCLCSIFALKVVPLKATKRFFVESKVWLILEFILLIFWMFVIFGWLNKAVIIYSIFFSIILLVAINYKKRGTATS